MYTDWVALLKIFLFVLGPIAIGLFSIFGKDHLWEMTALNDLISGKISKRTKLWDIWANIGGALFIAFGLFMLWTIIFSS